MDTPLVFFVPEDNFAEWRTALSTVAPDAWLTSDPEAAARRNFPRQQIVVVGPTASAAWLGWFAGRYPRLRVEWLESEDPQALPSAWQRWQGADPWPKWWTARDLKVGATLSAEAGVVQLAALTSGRATAVRVPVGLSALLPRVLAEQAPATTVVLFAGPVAGRAIRPLEFVTTIATGISAWYRTGVRALELCPEPNLPRGGYGTCWSTVAEFGEWWSQAADVLRRLFPEIRIGWPGVAPTWMARALAGIGDEPFLGAASTTTQIDWVGVRAHWRDEREILAEGGGLNPWRFRQAWPGRLLIVTGFGPVDASEPEPDRARQCARFVDQLQALPGVAAAFTDGAAGSWWAPGGRVSTLALRLGERATYSVANN